MRALACLGDKTTFGEVISASTTWLEGNQPIAQAGDLASCSRCKGAFPIIGTAYDWMEQQPFVATGDKVACRCSDHVVFGSATQYTTVALNSMDAPVKASAFDNGGPAPVHIAKSFARSFVVTDSNTGKPLAHRAYVAVVDGQRKEGSTDTLGMVFIKAPAADSVIELHVMFQAPYRDFQIGERGGKAFTTKATAREMSPGQTLTPVSITVNDRAATREAISKELRSMGATFIERSFWGALKAKPGMAMDWIIP